jgi:hypothetical protein
MPSLTIDDSFAPANDTRASQIRQTPPVDTQQAERARSKPALEDSTQISALSAELLRAINEEPPDVVNRIEQLEQAVATNSLASPPDEIANAILNEALRGDGALEELVGAGPQAIQAAL